MEIDINRNITVTFGSLPVGSMFVQANLLFVKLTIDRARCFNKPPTTVNAVTYFGPETDVYKVKKIEVTI